MVIRLDAKAGIRRRLSTAQNSQATYTHLDATGTEFQTFCEDLTGICTLLERARQTGSTAMDESRYQQLRNRLESQYPRLKPILLAYCPVELDQEFLDESRPDPIRGLWSADSLTSFINQQDVFFRDRVGRTLESLAYYNDLLLMLREAAR